MADDCESTENNEDKVNHPDKMPPPCLPEKHEEKTEKKNEGLKEKPSTKEKKETIPELPYKVPSWSGNIPDDLYSLEVLKNGCIISNIDLTSKPFHVFGRLPNCDVSLEHPSVSRYHAVIQYKTSDSSNSEKGFYIYDLGSTHGTTVNKSRLEPKRYYRLRVGYVFKFGGSSRLFVLQGPEEPGESDSNPAPTEQAAPRSSEVGRVMTEEEYDEWRKEREGEKQVSQDTGIDWGMGEDAVEEPAYPPEFGDVDQEAHHHFKDPKKTLRGFFEREGLELEYDVEEKGPGHARVYHCKVKLPIDGPSGEPLYAEAAVTGRKKEAVLECAQEACRMLDAAGLLRQSSHESKKHKEKNWEENDFYDSDEDSFLDRTGSVEKKRIQRMKRAGKDKPTMETYESLTLKLEALDSEIQDCENRLQKDGTGSKGANFEGADSLDDYMNSLGTSIDKTTRTQIRRKVFELRKERQRLVKLLNIAMPTSLPPVAEPASSVSATVNDELTRKTETEKSITSDSTEVTTVDQDTDSRHQSAAVLETPVKVDNSDTNHANLPERKPEFAVPVLPTLPKRKNKTPSKTLVEEPSRDKETESSENTETSEQLENKNQSGRKRVGSEDIEKEEKDKTEENNTASPKKKKKRSYNAPSQWEAVSDPTYTTWMPPEGQTGDGRTHLNEKFGY